MKLITLTRKQYNKTPKSVISALLAQGFSIRVV